MAGLPAKTQLISELARFIGEHHGKTFEADSSDLVSIGVMDSYTMLLLLNRMKDFYGIDLDAERMDFEVFRSLVTFVDFVFASAEAS